MQCILSLNILVYMLYSNTGSRESNFVNFTAEHQTLFTFSQLQMTSLSVIKGPAENKLGRQYNIRITARQQDQMKFLQMLTRQI